MACKAESAGCGGPTVKDDNEAGHDFHRNPKGRGAISPHFFKAPHLEKSVVCLNSFHKLTKRAPGGGRSEYVDTPWLQTLHLPQGIGPCDFLLVI